MLTKKTENTEKASALVHLDEVAEQLLCEEHENLPGSFPSPLLKKMPYSLGGRASKIGILGH